MAFTMVNSCPACGSKAVERGETSSPQVTVEVGGRNFIQPPYSIRGCGDCGLYYKTATLSNGDFAEYYRRIDFRGLWEIPGYFPTERVALKYLGGLPGQSRLLDFGCSTGRLLSGLTGRYECHGFEINAEAAREAEAKGLRMWRAEELSRARADFDAIILSDVFEHLTDPSGTLRELCKALKPRGSLMLITGNADAPYCQRNPAMFWYLREPSHVCMLTRRHAAFLEKQLGVRLKFWREMCHYDVGPWKRFRTHARDIAYWGSKPEAGAWLRILLGCVPVFRRAKMWPGPPGMTCTRDHVVAVFEKN